MKKLIFCEKIKSGLRKIYNADRLFHYVRTGVFSGYVVEETLDEIASKLYDKYIRWGMIDLAKAATDFLSYEREEQTYYADEKELSCAVSADDDSNWSAWCD